MRVKFLRGKSCIAIEGAEMIRERIAREVEKFALKLPNGAADAHTFMHVISVPLGAFAMKQAHFAIGIPAAVQYPSAQILGKPRHGVSIAVGTRRFESQNVGFQFFGEDFVGVEREYPWVDGCLRGEILLGGLSKPGVLNHASAQGHGDFAGAVR